MDKNEGVTDGCFFFAVVIVVLVFIGALIFGAVIGAPVVFTLNITLGTAFVLVLIMLGIETLTGIFHIEP